ncbi:hypothetical protein VTN49DRAFT_3853 [Thermomyces lanuginosus]|uniref:uncharacterized protein n=1 Tax=Thermomyces lanuginosus TaxID=5541 RepID=UPI003744291E
MTEPRVLRPRPRRAFELPSNSSFEDSEPPTPSSGATQQQPQSPSELTPTSDFLDVKNGSSFSRSGSMMALNSSTLHGIFQKTALESPRTETNDPWDTKYRTTTSEQLAQQARNEETVQGKGKKGKGRRRRLTGGGLLALLGKSSLLFISGVAYGTIMAHLHENHYLTPVQLEVIDRTSYRYLGLWGIGGVALAFVLPWLDRLFGAQPSLGDRNEGKKREIDRGRAWTLAVRSIGAFVGIAFALRRLPWESTTQESLALTLVNPFLWYLIDRTRTGFWLSTAISLAGMGVILGLHPDLLPTTSNSAAAGVGGLVGLSIAQDALAVAIWLASVLFCACVCFGNIGRQLALFEDASS